MIVPKKASSSVRRWRYNIAVYQENEGLMPDFEVVSPYKPQGDQPAAIDELEKGSRAGINSRRSWASRVLGKPFRWHHTIARLNRPNAW